MQGRKPLPTAIKEANGNPGKRPLNPLEPKPQGNLEEAPDWFNAEQAKAWRYAILNMPPGVLKRIDSSALTIWVVAEYLHREATEKVMASGIIVKTERGNPIQNPYLPVINRQAQIMLKAASELGFTPASRPRLEIDPDAFPNEEDDPLAEFTQH